MTPEDSDTRGHGDTGGQGDTGGHSDIGERGYIGNMVMLGTQQCCGYGDSRVHSDPASLLCSPVGQERCSLCQVKVEIKQEESEPFRTALPWRPGTVGGRSKQPRGLVGGRSLRNPIIKFVAHMREDCKGFFMLQHFDNERRVPSPSRLGLNGG